MKAFSCYCRRLPRHYKCILLTLLFTEFVLVILYMQQLLLEKCPNIFTNTYHLHPRLAIEQSESSNVEQNPIFDYVIQWNRSLCNIKSDQRRPNQKVIGISIYDSSSKYATDQRFSWNITIFPMLKGLVNEVKELLPSWIIRVYTDSFGITESQQKLLDSFSNVDICDIRNIFPFNSSLYAYLPPKMWRYLPILDPLVDYFLSHDLDSPMIQRESETIDFWSISSHQNFFFYIVRDHFQHNVPILGGLWGAAPIRARRYLFDAFQPMLVPLIGQQYHGTRDQQFLHDYIWNKVKDHAMTFDSFYCKSYGGSGRPFFSQRSEVNCFLGCARPCCTSARPNDHYLHNVTCPIACRPRNHRDWIYC